MAIRASRPSFDEVLLTMTLQVKSVVVGMIEAVLATRNRIDFYPARLYVGTKCGLQRNCWAQTLLRSPSRAS